MRIIRKSLLFILTLALIFSATTLGGPKDKVSAVDYCTSETCKAAMKALEEATEKADKAKEQADTLEGEIQRLQADVERMESKIEANKEIVEDVKVQIAEQQAILEQQQAGFAEIGADVHFKEKESELVQALRYSISERAEKKARDENVKAQISSSVNTINENMRALEVKKAQVEALIEDQKFQADQIEQNKAKQSELKAKYEEDASKFNEEAKEAARIKLEEEKKKADEIAANNSVGKVVASGLNTYPKAGDCPQSNYTNIGYVIYYDGMAICQCTSYANWKVKERWGKSAVGFGIYGDAKYWGTSAAAVGLRVDNIPEIHTVGYQTSGTYGHVVWIEKVNNNGTVDLSEYNNYYSSVSGQKGDFGYRVNVPASNFRYIHFGDKK